MIESFGIKAVWNSKGKPLMFFKKLSKQTEGYYPSSHGPISEKGTERIIHLSVQFSVVIICFS